MRTLKAKWIQLRGKIRRIYLSHFRRRYVQQQLKRRRGECLRCGACCKFVFVCPFLARDGDGQYICRIHSRRPVVCSDFPIDERDLSERDLIKPETRCGYYFITRDEEGDR